MNFKKQISILIAFLILVSNSGLAFNVHFCEGKIASVTSVFSKEEVCDTSESELAKHMPVEIPDTCCAKQDTSHDKCCSDKEVKFKDDVEKLILKISIDANFIAVFNDYTFTDFKQLSLKKYNDKIVYNCDANAPPLYQLYCQYTFYA